MYKENLRAILGPTNTGKTYFAIERMLAHASGIMGFPLRLLARENYDKISKTLGKDKVALITGEEKIIPKNASYFCCTVEAMPIEKNVEFIGTGQTGILLSDGVAIDAVVSDFVAGCLLYTSPSPRDS